jgi:predicted Zn-ribbon and HTH transcriptional regulator
MNEIDEQHRPPAKEWNNCPVRKCGYFYKQSVLDQCPMCKHPWRLPPSYTQPPYEPPTLE